MEFAELKKSLKTQKPHACYCCYGDDDYLLSRAVSLLKELASEPKAFNVSDREFSSARDLTDELMQLPIMGEYRVVTARGKVDKDAIEEYLRSPNPSAVLVTVEYIPHDSWNKAAAPTYPKNAVVVDCNRLDIKYVAGFVRKIAAQTGAQIGDGAMKMLYSRCGGYMTRINAEAEKLALLCADGEITENIVSSEVRADTEFVVFELTDSIVKRDAARALGIVDGMAKNNDLVAAFTLLYNRFKKMFALAVDPDGATALGIKPFMANKMRDEAARFGKPRLKKMLDELADADRAYKTGMQSQYDALYAFVARAACE